jgi:hypothetical protein
MMVTAVGTITVAAGMTAATTTAVGTVTEGLAVMERAPGPKLRPGALAR